MCQPGSETLPAETSAEDPSVPAVAHRYKLREAYSLVQHAPGQNFIEFFYWRQENESWSKVRFSLSWCFGSALPPSGQIRRSKKSLFYAEQSYNYLLYNFLRKIRSCQHTELNPSDIKEGKKCFRQKVQRLFFFHGCSGTLSVN